jgi:hypothetical protein
MVSVVLNLFNDRLWVSDDFSNILKSAFIESGGAWSTSTAGAAH